MKKVLAFSMFIVVLTSCGVDCSDYPVGPHYRGTYTVSQDGQVYFEGADGNGQRVRVLIPEDYYDLNMKEDGSYDLECHCSYGGE